MEASSQHVGEPEPDRGLGQRYHFKHRVICSSVPHVSDLSFPPQRLMIMPLHLCLLRRWNQMKSDCSSHLFLQVSLIPQLLFLVMLLVFLCRATSETTAFQLDPPFKKPNTLPWSDF